MFQELYTLLLRDIKKIGVDPSGFNLKLKPYSKTLYGRFNPNTFEIIVYVYRDKDRKTMYTYKELLLTLVHESIHYIQWSDKNFVRVKGVSHNSEFYRLLNIYSDRVNSLLLLREIGK